MKTSLSDRAAADGETYQVVHKWTPGDGAAAVDAFLDAFNRGRDGVGVEDSVSDNLGLTVKTSILREDPPDFWMGWPGQTLRPYYEAGVLRDLTEFWDDREMRRAFLDGLIEAVTLDGDPVAVPTNVHRINNLFYDVEAAEAAGFDPRRIDDPRELVEVMEQLAGEYDGLPMAQSMKMPRTVLQLWEITLLGQFGEEAFHAVMDGDADRHRSEIAETLELVDAMADLADDDVVFTDFVDAAEQFADREAAMFAQGDWLAEVFEGRDDFEYGRDWERVPYPGTEGQYHVVTDAVMTTHAVDLDAGAREFLEFAASAEGQTVFNRPKGSIPARADVDMDSFTPFLRDQHEAFHQSRSQPPTVAHGLAVEPSRHVELEAAMGGFVKTRDVASATDDVIAALSD